MGVPLSIEPQEAILECIRIAGGEVRYCSDRIAELEAEGVALAAAVVTTHERPRKYEKGEDSPSETVTEVKHEAPALHIWVQARHQAMDRLVSYSAAAIKAGIAERLVKIAEDQAQMLAEAMRRMAEALGHRPSDPRVREAMRASLTLIAGGHAA